MASEGIVEISFPILPCQPNGACQHMGNCGGAQRGRYEPEPGRRVVSSVANRRAGEHRLPHQGFGRTIARIRDGSTIRRKRGTHNMAFPLSIVGGLLLVGYVFSRMNARQGSKRNIQTILDTKKD
jgi:hypothetical protein